MLKGEGGRTGRPSSPFMSGGVGHRLRVVVWGPRSPCVVLGTCRRLWVVLLGAHGFSWVVFLGTRHFSWVEVLLFEGEGRGSSFVCAGPCCHLSALAFCAVCLSLLFAVRCCLLSVSVIAGCLSSGVVSCRDVAADMVAGLPIRGG